MDSQETNTIVKAREVKWHPPLVQGGSQNQLNLLDPNAPTPNLIKSEMREVQHELNFDRSSKISALKGKYNDGLVGAGVENFSGINWKEKPDDQVQLKAGALPNTTSFQVNGPIRIEPISNTIGYESAVISVSWSRLDKRGNRMPELINPDHDTYNVGGGNLLGQPLGPGYLDFSPPYPDENPYGYEVHITTPPQYVPHGNPTGIDLRIYTQQGDERTTMTR